MADESCCEPTGPYTANPLVPCTPGPYVYAACYVVPPSQVVLTGTKSITLNPDCTAASVVILDANDVPVVGAVEVACLPPSTSSLTVQDDGVVVATGATCLNFTGAASATLVGNCIEVNVTPGAVACPFLASCTGTCAAPTYSFAAAPTSGMWMNAGVLTISANNCDDFIELGASVNVGSNTSSITLAASTFITIGAGTTIDLTLASHLSLNAVPGVAGQVLTTNGPGLPPSWQTPSGGSPALYAEDPVAFVAPIANGDNSVVIGSGAVSSAASTNAMVFGTGAQGAGTDIVVIGTNASTFGANTGAVIIGFGAFTNISNTGVVAIGQDARTGPGATDGIAIGRFSASQADAAISIGETTIAAGIGSIAFGSDANAQGVGSIAIGDGALTNNVAATNAVAIGVGATATHANAVALGDGAVSSAVDQITLGRGVLVEVVPGADGTVTLGSAARGWEAVFVSADNSYRASGQTSGAGASLGTLTNAPSAGNPAFWLRVVINGVNHFIPAWV